MVAEATPMTCSRRGIVALAVLALAATAAARAEPTRYTIDPEHLSLGFLVEHVGFAKVLGMFRKGSGAFTFDEERGTISEVAIEIDAASVYTNHEKRDEHLRGADFLNAAEFPMIRFTAASAEPTGEREFDITGELTLLGQTRPLTLRAVWNKSGQSPVGGGLFSGKPYVTGVSARGAFKRSDFGMRYAVSNGWVGDTVELIIEIEAKRE